MFRGLNKVSFDASDHAAAKTRYSTLFGIEPYFDVPGYFEFRLDAYASRCFHRSMSTNPGQPTGHFRGRRLTIERTFRAPIEDVWASLTEPDRVALWYGTIDGDARTGQTIMVTMVAEDGAPAEPIQIIECDAPRRFLIETAGMGEPWRLLVELTEVAGITTMTFTQDLGDDLDASDVGPGWEFYADRHDAARNDNEMPDWTNDRYQELLGPHYSNG